MTEKLLRTQKKRLKIGVVIDQLLPGGVQKSAIEEVRWLNKLGHEAKLIILMRKGFEKKFGKFVQSLPCEFLSDRYPKLFQKSFKFPFFTFLSTLHLVSPVLASFKIKKGEFDLIVSHGTTTSLTTWSISKLRKIPYLAVIHDPMVYILDKVYSATPLRFFFPVLKPISTFLEAVFTKSAKFCLVDSSVHAKYLQEKYQVKPVVLYLGINPAKKLPQKLGSAILAFGRWDKGKNPEILLKLLGKFPKTKLIIAGSWTKNSEMGEFKRKIKLANLSKRVELIPKYTEEQLTKICQAGRVWVHPHFEAFSLSALEAASHGLPIVIPAKSGVTEIFRDGIHGFFPKKITLTEFQKAISPLLKNQKLAFKMGSDAALTAKNYTPEQRALKLLNLINRLFQKTVEIVAIETGAISGSLVAGGDRLLEEMVKRIPKKLSLTVIIPKIAQNHWEQAGVKVNFEILPGNSFEKFTGPFGVFANYLLRIWQSLKILRRIAKDKGSNHTVIYSSTGIWPDIMPAFGIKILNPKLLWLARIHHLSPPPQRRPGRLWVNFGAYFLQKLSLFAINVKANLILVLNSKLKNDLVNLNFSKNKMVILGGGVDFAAISTIPSPTSKKFDAVFLGRIHPAKGVFDLAPVWQQVVKNKPNAKLALVGTGPENLITNLRNQIKNYNLEKNIKLLGFLPRKKVWETLTQSKVFLFTDHEAGWGLAAAESLAAGTPIVGWDIGVLGSVFKSGFLVIPQNNYHLFAEKICLLLENQKLYQKLSKLAKAEAAKFDWEKISLKFQNILSKISN